MTASVPSLRSARHPIHLVLGLGAWALWFCAAYGGLSVACAVSAPPPGQGPWTAVNAVLLVFTLATAAGLLAASRAAWLDAGRALRELEGGAGGGRDRFMATGAAALYLVAAVCTLVVGAPLLLLPPCL